VSLRFSVTYKPYAECHYAECRGTQTISTIIFKYINKIFLESHITQQFLIFFRIIFEVFCRFIMQGTQSLARMLRVVKNMAA